jgi:hypothetical protein
LPHPDAWAKVATPAPYTTHEFLKIKAKLTKHSAIQILDQRSKYFNANTRFGVESDLLQLHLIAANLLV